MNTPADAVDAWLASSTGPLSMVVGAVALLAVVRVAVSFMQSAARASS